MIACKRITWKECGSIMSNMLHVKTKWIFFIFFTTGKHTAIAYKLDSYVLKSGLDVLFFLSIYILLNSIFVCQIKMS